jgi:hypothetical protein
MFDDTTVGLKADTGDQSKYEGFVGRADKLDQFAVMGARAFGC